MLGANFLNLIFLPLAIFFVRIVDVSLGTIRVIFISRGIRIFSAILGFFEVLIWLFAVGQIMRNLDSPMHYIAYAAGFGMGNFVGISIEKKLSYGHRIITLVTQKDATALVQSLRGLGFNLTILGGEGKMGPVKIIFSVVKKGQVGMVLKAIQKFNPNAFYTIEDIKAINEDAPAAKNGGSWLPAAFRAVFQKMK